MAAIAGYRHERVLADDAPSALACEPAGGPARVAWPMAAREAECAAAALGRALEPKALLEGPQRRLEREL